MRSDVCRSDMEFLYGPKSGAGRKDAAVVENETTEWVHLDGESSGRNIQGFEFFSARRALQLLKSRHGRKRLLDLLQDDITAGDAFLRTVVERSEGQQVARKTTLRAHGISAAPFGSWPAGSFDRESVMLTAHPEQPEHSVIRNPGPGRAHIVETLDEQVGSFFMEGWDESDEQQPAAPA